TQASVARIDPGAGSVTQPVGVGNGPDQVVAGAGSVWVANRLDGTVARVTPAANAVADTLPTGGGPPGIPRRDRHVRAAGGVGAPVNRFSLAGEELAANDVGVAVVDVTLVGDTVWFSSRGSPTSHRGGTLTLVSAVGIDSLDPAVALPDPLVSLLSDGLVGYR